MVVNVYSIRGHWTTLFVLPNTLILHPLLFSRDHPFICCTGRMITAPTPSQSKKEDVGMSDLCTSKHKNKGLRLHKIRANFPQS